MTPKTKKFHGTVLFCSGPCNLEWRVVGHHKKLGAGVLSYHKQEADARHNAAVINEFGGEARYERNSD